MPRLDPQPERSAEAEREREAEQVLVARLGQGDPDAFTRIMTQFIEPLTRFAWSLLRSRDAAEDVVQQVFVELWERRESAQPQSLKPYLYRAVRNRVLNEHRAGRVRERHISEIQSRASSDPTLSSTGNPEEHLLTTQEFRTAMAQLGERRRLAVRLRVEEEMTHNEIADVLGISAAAAQSLVSRGLTELRKIIWG